MIVKRIILGFLFVVGLLLTACTTTGSSPITESEAMVTVAAATAVPPTSLHSVPDPTNQQLNEVQPILDSFTSTIALATNKTIEHNGLTFTYDPTLLDETHIQDIPATSDEGMFAMPSPAHTWIGFVPGGIQRDPANHWLITHQSQIIVFNLSDFGSFAWLDEQARTKISEFQQLLAERPSTINGEIPLLPLVNAAQTIQAQLQWLDFGNGTGVRFVTAYSQDTLPVTNDRLLYIFYGMTDDGLHGVTAVFPLAAAGLPDTVPQMSDDAFAAFSQNYAAEMTAVTDRLNAQPDSDFNPQLSQLDALVQSITILPNETDYPIVMGDPQHGQLLADTDVFNAPTGDETINSLPSGEGIVVNGTSNNGRRFRILCADGSTSNCWVDVDSVQINSIVDEPVLFVGGMPEVGVVVQVTAVTNNPIYAKPSHAAAVIGTLLAGEAVEIAGIDDTGLWLNVACPRGIGIACWVAANTAVNEPTDFYLGDGWQDVTSDYVTFRVPGNWQIMALTPNPGSVLAEWHLGIPGIESDQFIAFSAVPFDKLKPNDVVREDMLEIGGQPGVKWTRSGEGYISYDYYTAGTAAAQAAGAGSFGLHVTLAEANPDLESQLDMVAYSVIFTP